MNPPNDPALKALGDAIRRARGERGLSQDELAYRSGIDQSYMSSIECGKQSVGFMLLLGIARALELSVAELMSRAGL